MTRSWLSKKRSLLRALAAAAMGCLFGCFRFQDSSSSSSSSAAASAAAASHLPSSTTDLAAKKGNSLSSLLLSGDEDRVESGSKEKESIPTAESYEQELKDEARFLKACGTLAETPAEIRKFSKEWNDQSGGKGELEYPKFRSWLVDMSVEKLNLEKQLDQPPTPVKNPDLVERTDSLEQTPSSCMTGGQSIRRISTSSAEYSGTQNVIMPDEAHDVQNCSSATSSASTRNMAPSVQGRNKTVRFDCESSLSSISGSSSSENRKWKNFEEAGNFSVSKPSPYPTPLKLSDEMQTPGTVFPAYLNNIENGKKTRIRSQYVYSVVNPANNFSQLKVLNDEHYDPNQPSGQLGQSLEQVDVGSSLENGMRVTSAGKESKVEASLSSWLRPPVTNQDGNNYSTSLEDVHCGKTPGDRPILGMVAAHWKDDEPSRISPKWWDGNGIPNSTNKYKEDQKVSWHATPFEERLEKALSEETFISQRKQIGGGTPPIDFGESEESDTALSKFESSTNFKSVVSC